MAHILKKRIALIGCGNIANFHAEAFIKAGFKILFVTSKSNSKRIKKFAKKFKIKNIIRNPNHFLEATKNKVDAYLILTPVEKTLGYLKKITDIKMPVFVEKPIDYSYKKLIPFKNKKNIFVAYNRRFYSSIKIAKEFIINNKKSFVQFEVPEQIQSKNFTNKHKNYKLLFANSVHAFDLINYLFKNPLLKNKNVIIENGKIKSITATFISKKGDLIVYIGNWNASANWSIKIDNKNKRLLLAPFEKASIFEGIEVIHPGKNKIRLYQPKIKANFKIPIYEKNYKPGFYLQALEFKKFINTNKKTNNASINDAINALKVAEKLTKAS